MCKKYLNRLVWTSKLRNGICIITLLVMVVEEHFISLLLQEGCVSTWILVLAGLALLSGLFYLLHRKDALAKFELSTFRKLFQNLVSAPLSFFILLYFLIHLEWISNAGYDAFFTEEGFQWPHLLLMAVNIAAVVASIFLYPKHVLSRSPFERELVVSGLSMVDNCVRPRNIDLLIKPFLDSEWEGADGRSPSASKMVIIPSNEKSSITFLPLKADFQDGPISVFSFVAEEKRVEIQEQYNKIIANGKPMDAILKDLIQLLTGKEITLTVEDNINYDNMKDALSRIAEVLARHETRNDIQETFNTLLYISPGTGVIGSALTAFAIPGNRVVLYFTQTRKDNALVYIGLETGGHNSIVEEMLEKE